MVVSPSSTSATATFATSTSATSSLSSASTPTPTSAKRRDTGMAITPVTASAGRPSLLVTITPAASSIERPTPPANTTLRNSTFRTHSSSPGSINTILFGGAESTLIDQDIVPCWRLHHGWMGERTLQSADKRPLGLEARCKITETHSITSLGGGSVSPQCSVVWPYFRQSFVTHHHPQIVSLPPSAKSKYLSLEKNK